MATSDMYKSNGKENLLVLNKANSAAQYPGATVYADGAVYTSDSYNWEDIEGANRWTDKSLVIISDSRGAQGMVKKSAPTVGLNAYRGTSIGFSSWLQFLSKQMFQRVIVSSRPGRRAQQLADNDTSESALDTMQIAVIEPKATDALIYLGVNDLSWGRTGEQLAADILKIARAARNSGKRVTVLLDNYRSSGATASQISEWFIHANLLYAYAAKGEFFLVDATKDHIDWTNTTTLQFKTTLYYDGVHPNTLSGYILGKALFDHYSKIDLPVSSYRKLHYLNAHSNDTRNPNMVENSGFATNLNGWYTAAASGAITAISSSRIPSPDGYGYAMAVDVTVNAATHVNLTIGSFTNTPAYAVGDNIYGEVGVSVVGNGGTGNQTGVATPWLRLNLANDGSGLARQYDLWPEQTANAQAVTGNFEGVARTMPYVFTGSETLLLNGFVVGAYFASAGSARFIITNPQVIKNSTPYSPDEWLVQ